VVGARGQWRGLRLGGGPTIIQGKPVERMIREGVEQMTRYSEKGQDLVKASREWRREDEKRLSRLGHRALRL
jgi:hypothetical protein